MAKVSKPESDKDVFLVMKKYCQDKGYSFSDTQLRFMAENCYLLYESKRWYGIKYWPPLAMKWVLNERCKFGKNVLIHKNPKVNKGKSVRDRIMGQENE